MSNNHKKGYKYIVLLTSLYVIITSCKTIESSVVKPPISIPEKFVYQDSMQGASTVSKHIVFTDTVLVELITTAIMQNPDVLVAAQRIEMAKAQLKFRKGAMLPTVDVHAAGAARKYGNYTMEGVGNFDTNLSGNIDEDQKVSQPIVPDYFLGLRSNWEIDLWGKLKNQKRAAYMLLLASEEGRNLIITTLIAEVASRYYELQALDAEQEIFKKNILLQDSAIQIAIVQKEAGRTTELGVQQFQAQLLRTKSALVNNRQQLVRVENELNLLLGRFPQPIRRQHDFLLTAIPASAMLVPPTVILDKRPDVLRAQWELKANDADVTAARAALLPSLSLSPFIGYNSFNSGLLFNPSSLAYGIIGGLTAPLLNRSSLNANISKAEAAKNEAYQLYYKTVISAYGEIETTLSNMKKLQEIYDLNLRETELLAEAVITSNELYRVGYASYLEVITAQRNAIDAAVNAIETKKAIHYNLVSLYRSIGGGW